MKASWRHVFGLTQVEASQYLGLSKAHWWQIEQNLRPVPLAVAPAYTALATAALLPAPAPTPEPPHAAALHRQLSACRLQVARLTQELRRMQERSTWATCRLAALPTLTQALTPPDAPAPAWLARFAERARQELVRSGPTAQALLQARLAGTQAEAAALEQLLPPA